jgi:hypothetical protein
VRLVHVDQCVSAVRTWRWQYWTAYVAAEICDRGRRAVKFVRLVHVDQCVSTVRAVEVSALQL